MTKLNHVSERFLTYVQHHTTSDDNSKTFPSTTIQLDFAAFLAEECKKIGLSQTLVDKYGYVTATLPSNIDADLPVIGFIAHMDTSPDAPGKNIRPNIVENYDGGIIPLLEGVVLSSEEFPDLLLYKGDTLITSDGTTLLGADDKAGIAEILTAMEYLLNHPEIKHGEIKIAFTPDEEIGHGVDNFNVKSFGADFAYTVDGGKLGEVEYENFNAARANITIKGKSVHPGTAKNAMINAVLIGAEIATALPKDEIPAKTERYEGFFHLCSLTGNVSSASLSYIIRDFDKEAFEERKSLVQTIVDGKNRQYEDVITLELYDEYYNMVSKIQGRMEIVTLAETAMKECGVLPLVQPIRGGTDGARLSFMGLPCPNLFTGGHNFHGPYEFIPVSSMEKAVDVIVKIAELVAKENID